MNILSALYCECIKIVRSKVFWLTFVFFAVSLTIMSFGIKEKSWTAFFTGLVTIGANMGLLVNFFIASWVFGREFMDKTNKDLIAKPMTRLTVVSSKFTIIFLWCIGFMIFLLLSSFAIGFLLGFTGFAISLLTVSIEKFILTGLLYIIICSWGAFFASITRGILAPIGILFVIAVAANVLGHSWAAVYFPWTIPNVFRETGHLNPVSMVILIATGIAGIAGTFVWWRFADQE
ncbi:MAG: ABC transporter permease [Treponema sp.]|nr:ABC transporter permease [Treponema sp.]